jgi:hypothetical protein
MAAEWETRWTELNELLAHLRELGPSVERQNPSPLWAHLQNFNALALSFIAVPSVYFRGFDRVLEDPNSASTSLSRWVLNVDRNRSAYTLACMYATAQCSALEGFLRAFSNDWLDEARLVKIQTLSRSARNGQTEALSHRLDGARNQLDAWLRPSGGGAFAEWVRILEHVFGITVVDCVRESVSDLVSLRHAVVHPDQLLTDDQLPRIDGAQFSAWGHACMWLALTISLTAIPED